MRAFRRGLGAAIACDRTAETLVTHPAPSHCRTVSSLATSNRSPARRSTPSASMSDVLGDTSTVTFFFPATRRGVHSFATVTGCCRQPTWWRFTARQPWRHPAPRSASSVRRRAHRPRPTRVAAAAAEQHVGVAADVDIIEGKGEQVGEALSRARDRWLPRWAGHHTMSRTAMVGRRFAKYAVWRRSVDSIQPGGSEDPLSQRSTLLHTWPISSTWWRVRCSRSVPLWGRRLYTSSRGVGAASRRRCWNPL